MQVHTLQQTLFNYSILGKFGFPQKKSLITSTTGEKDKETQEEKRKNETNKKERKRERERERESEKDKLRLSGKVLPLKKRENT